jgi:hypothetical protein
VGIQVAAAGIQAGVADGTGVVARLRHRNPTWTA